MKIFKPFPPHLILFACWLGFALSYGPVSAETIVVGYYPAWVRSSYPPAQIQFENLTHVNHAFAWPEANGGLASYDQVPDLKLIEQAHHAGKKVLIALGGWGHTAGFSPMAASPNARATFIQNLVNFCTTNGYDGVDFDWEYPENSVDRNNFNLLVAEVRQAFNQVDSTMLVTMAVSAGAWFGQWFDYPTLKKEVDWFGCMTYDFHGGWSDHAGHNSPLYAPAHDHCGSVESGMQYLLSRGIRREQILIGLPFYGREFNAAQLYGASTGSEKEYHYSEIVSLMQNGWDYHWDDVSKVPYLTNTSRTKLISFDDTLSIRLKSEYAKRNQLRGVMIWALGQDRLPAGQPLLATVGKSLGTATGVAKTIAAHPTELALLNNYPNPFNSETRIAYQLPRDIHVRIRILNMQGQAIKTLIDEFQSGGTYTICWDGQDAAGGVVPSGLYFYQMQAGQFSAVKKLMLVK